MTPEVHISALSRDEAMAEKLRAALSRRDVAIRDFYDVDHAVQRSIVQPTDRVLLDVLRQKLAVPGNAPVDVSEKRRAALKRQLDERFSPFVHLVFPQMTVPELLAYLAAGLGAMSNPNSTAPVDETVRCLQYLLRDNSARGSHAVIAIDEAQLLLDSGALETLRLLLNFEEADKPALTLLLVGQPQLLPALQRLPGLEARLGVKCLLRTFSLEETVSYVTHRMVAAGSTHEIFTSEALSALHQLTSGNPRRINRLCDLALLIGFAEEQRRINAPQIEAVCNELVTIAPE